MRPSTVEAMIRFIEASDEHRAEIDGPDTVVNLLEAESLAAERMAGEDEVFLPLDHPVVGDDARFHPAVVLDPR